MAAAGEVPPPGEITARLAEVAAGDPAAAERLFLLVRAWLHREAVRRLAREGVDPLVQPTLLLDEAFWRLLRREGATFKDRGHFFRAAGRCMRLILVDLARRRTRVRRGGGAGPESLVAEPPDPRTSRLDLVLDVEQALQELEAANPRWARVFELRHYLDLSAREVADALRLSRRTVEMDWNFARAWLQDRLRG